MLYRKIIAVSSHIRTKHNFWARPQNFEKRLLASSCLSVRPSVRMEQLGSHWTDFQEILYLSIFRKPVEKIQVSLKSYKNKGYFTRRLLDFLIISHSALLRMRNVSEKKVVEKTKRHILCSITFFENRAVYEICGKI
jgi:hypothetical protein